MNVLRWCPFVHLFDTPFQNSPHAHKITDVLKLRNSATIDLSCSDFSFYEHFYRQFNYVVFYIQNHQMCLTKNIFYEYFVDFLPCLGQLLL